MLLCVLQQFLLDTQIEDTVIFKFEPFVLHVQCRTIDHARLLVRIMTLNAFNHCLWLHLYAMYRYNYNDHT